MDKDNFSAILEAQQDVISMITRGHALPDCLDSICLLIDAILDDNKARCSVLLLEGTQLRHGAAPLLPKAYCEAIDGVEIGSNVGSCGTAAFIGKQVIVSDIEHDPLWRDYKNVALEHGLRACWSTPVMSASNEVLGTFAIYYLEPKMPARYHFELIERFTHLSSLAMEWAKSSSREAALTSELKQSNGKFAAFTSVMPDLALILEEDGTYTDVYGAADALLYRAAENVLGKTVADVLPPENAREVMGVVARTLDSGKVEVFEYELDVPKGSCIFEGRVTGIQNYLPESPKKRHVLWMARDITDRKLAEQQVEKLAFYDPLTSLPNRRFLIERLQSLIEKANRDQQIGALLYLDLDDFKRINDSLGHSIGDQLLIKAAKRLKPALRVSDTLARIGGDEFVIILETATKDIDALCEEASEVALKLIESFSDSFSIHKGEYRIGVSIGISIIHGGDITADEALKRADTAMYRSKKCGGNQFSFFDPELQRALDARLELEQHIIQSIKEREFCAYFQPQVGADQQVIGVEALIRWIHPEKGIVSPLDFIPVAEQFGLIAKLQKIVLSKACELLNALQKNNLLDDQFSVAVNISAVQFNNPSMKAELLETIRQFGVSPERIKLEITESMLIDNIDHTIAQMRELKDEGFRFSIDDFGTGYSSLTYLHTFPIDELKIDKSFIDKIHDNEVGAGIVDAIIALSQHMGFDVIAEGVELKEQVALLAERNVKAVQGYYFARPMPADQLIKWLSENNNC